MIGLNTGNAGHGIAFVGFMVVVLGLAGVIGHRRAVGLERLRRAGMYDIDVMSGQQFELRLAEAFQHAGYRVKHVGGSGDFGTDLLLEQNGVRTVVQAKWRSGSVGQPAVREAAAARAHYGAQRAMVVTNSVFTESARALAASNAVELWDRFLLGQFISAQLQTPRSQWHRSVRGRVGSRVPCRAAKHWTLLLGPVCNVFGCRYFTAPLATSLVVTKR